MSSADAIGILCSDAAHPRGGLGRAMNWLADALRNKGKSVTLLSRVAPCKTLLITVGPGGNFLFRKPKNCRVIAMSYHNYTQQSRLVPGQWWKRILVPFERRTLQLADGVLYASEDARTSLMNEYGIDPARLRMITPIFPLDEWLRVSAQKSPGLCVYVGRPDKRKGYDTLMAAWPSVQARVPHARLEIVNGNLSQEELCQLVASAALALCPAYLEGFGLAAAEAMAAGTPVVASNCEGLRTLVRDGETGILLPPDESDAWAQGVIALLQDDALRMRLGTQARAMMRERFDQTRAIQEWCMLF